METTASRDESLWESIGEGHEAKEGDGIHDGRVKMVSDHLISRVHGPNHQ